MEKSIGLIILDGFGYSPESSYNAIALANTPMLDTLLQKYPHCLLEASGPAVGLLPDQIGNSEAGHLTIGAGKIILQDITRITQDITNKSFFENPVLHTALHKAKKVNRLHLIGLVSDGGIHSHILHLEALLQATVHHSIKHVFIHAILDGRDTPPRSAAQFLHKIEKYIKTYSNMQIATIHGRFYAMDRDGNWARTEKSYTVLTKKERSPFTTWQEVIDHYYAEDITDEFIPPIQLNSQGIISDQDVVFFFNIRPERMHQLISPFIDESFNKFKVKELSNLSVFSMVLYNRKYKNIQVLYDEIHVEHTLKEWLAQRNKTIFTIAETEKYAHVTYFFDGMRNLELPQETRVLIPSYPEKKYSHRPEMSANEITDAICSSLEHDMKDFYLVNYANADMVGHSGNLEATIQAIECLDKQLIILYEEFVKKRNGVLIITGDHGKAEEMYDHQAQQPRTAHTTNPVFFIVVGEIKSGPSALQSMHGLSNIADFIKTILIN